MCYNFLLVTLNLRHEWMSGVFIEVFFASEIGSEMTST